MGKKWYPQTFECKYDVKNSINEELNLHKFKDEFNDESDNFD